MPSTQPLCEGSMRWQEREWLREQKEDWWDDVFDRIACGVSPRTIAKEYCLRYAILVRVIDETPARLQEYERALQIAADGYAHEVIEIADTTQIGETRKVFADGSEEVTTSDMLAHRKMRIETRLKLAGKWRKDRYGENGGLTVNVNSQAADVDIQALARKTAFLLRKGIEQGDVVDAVPAEVPVLPALEREPQIV